MTPRVVPAADGGLPDRRYVPLVKRTLKRLRGLDSRLLDWGFALALMALSTVECIAFGEGFLTTLGVSLLPFVIILGVSTVVHRLALVTSRDDRPRSTTNGGLDA